MMREPRNAHLAQRGAMMVALLAAVVLAACVPVMQVQLAPTATAVPTSMPTATPSPEPSPTPSPTSSPTPAPTAVPTLTPSAQAVPAGPRPGDPYELVLTEDELNRSMQSALAAQPNSPLSGAYVRLVPGQLIAGGKALVGLFTFDVQLAATVTAQAGRPMPAITEIWVNGQPAGGIVRTQLTGMIQPYLDQWTQTNLAVEVDDIQITQGQMRITGTYK